MSGKVELLEWRKLDKGQLIGVVRARLPIGLEIAEVLVLKGGEGPWAALPNRIECDSRGMPHIGADGKPRRQELLRWKTRKLQVAFSARIIELIRAGYPDDL